MFDPRDRSSQQTGNTTVRAMGINRFRIERVIHRALEGLILTCEVTVFHEEGSEEDIRCSEILKYKELQRDAKTFCRVCASILTP